MSDKKFTTLRKRLDQLGYRQPLVIEAVPLVEKLFSDLVHTTESFKNYKNKVKINENHFNIDDVSEPYKNDNAKLVRENNELHMQLIKHKDDSEALLTELKSTIRKFENENQDLKFLNSQYVHKIRTLEKESKQKSDHILTLQEKNMKAVIETPGGKKKSIPFRRQRMDIESTLLPSTSSLNSTNQSSSVDPYVADLLALADTRTEEIKHHMTDLQSMHDKLERKNLSLKKQIEQRDKEIERLNRMLDGGRPVESVLKDTQKSSSDKVVSHLNIQVDYLQQANRDLEKQLNQYQTDQAEATAAIKNLNERNEELCMELAALDKICKNIGKEKRQADEEVDQQIDILRNEVEEKHQLVLDLQSNNYNLKKERDSLLEETEQISDAIKNAQDDKKNIAEMYQRCDKEKRRLTEKNAKLTISERELAMDLERLKVSKGVLPKKSQSPNRLELLVRNIEDDRDYYKNECATLQKIIHKQLFAKSDGQVDSRKEKGAMLELMKEERDYYKKENELIQGTLPSNDRKIKNTADISRLRKERDELKLMLEKFEQHLSKIQEDVGVVTSDRDNIQLLYEQSSEEIQRLRRQLSRVRSPSSVSQKVTDILQKAEKERDEALHELRKSRGDIQSLRSEIRAAQASQFADQQLHSEKEKDVEELLVKLESDNGNMNTRLFSTQNMIRNLEDQLAAANQSICKANEELVEKQAEVSKLRLALQQNDRTCEELRKKIGQKAVENEERNEDNNKLEEKNDSLEKKLLEHKNEIVRLKSIVSSLDHERDNLQNQVDEKTEQLVHLDDGLRNQEKADQELKLSVEELEENLRYHEQELTSKDREIRSLSKQLRSMEEELSNVAQSRGATIKENKRTQDDLALMTEDNQAVHKNLQEVLDESHHLKQQIEEYALQLGRIQDLLSQKELEKEELILQYRTLSNKADILETNVQQSEDEAENYKQNIVHKQQEVNYLQDRCSALEAEVEQHINTEESYENQITALTHSLANMEAQLRVCNEEKDTILEDLFAVRELCVKLDQTREELTKKMAVKTTEKEKLEDLLNESQAETETLKKQVQLERENVKSLENIISMSREKEFFEHRSYQDNQDNLEKVQKDISKVEQDRTHLNVENGNLRHQNMSLHDQLTSIQKQLTTEKFERERLKQELRRNATSPLAGTKSYVDDDSLTRRKHEVTARVAATDSNIRSSYLGTTSRTKSFVPSASPVRSNVTGSFSPLNVSFSSTDGNESK